MTSYVVTASDGRTMTTAGTTVNFPGLTNGTLYYFTVQTYNSTNTHSDYATETSARPLARFLMMTGVG